MYKDIFDFVSDSFNELFIMCNSSTSRHEVMPYKLFQRYSRVDSGIHFFAELIIEP